LGKDHLVTSPEPSKLTEILDGLQARLEGALRGTRTAVTQPGARGDASEIDWLRVLNDHLPQRYKVDKAFVIDSRGGCSEEIDIVIYDRQYSPFLYNQADQRYVPAESVYGVIEVKQDLSREHVLYAAGKASSVRRLHRTSASISHAGGSYEPRLPQRIVGGIVTYQSSWTPPFGQPLRDALQELSSDGELDIGCSLINGVFEARYASGNPVDLTVIEGPRSLVEFLFRLLRQLQPIATVPAIKYDDYLDMFRRHQSPS
jgi:hypothetical protein